MREIISNEILYDDTYFVHLRQKNKWYSYYSDTDINKLYRNFFFYAFMFMFMQLILRKIVVNICFCFQRRYFYAFTDMGTRLYKRIDRNNWIAVSIFSSSSFFSSIVSSFLLLLLFSFWCLFPHLMIQSPMFSILSLSCNYWKRVSFSLC